MAFIECLGVSQEGGPPAEGELRYELGIALHGETCW